MIREWNEESLDHRNTLLYAMGISEERGCFVAALFSKRMAAEMSCRNTGKRFTGRQDTRKSSLLLFLTRSFGVYPDTGITTRITCTSHR